MTNHGSFDGSAAGPDEVVLFVNTSQPARILKDCMRLIAKYGLQAGLHAAILDSESQNRQLIDLTTDRPMIPRPRSTQKGRVKPTPGDFFAIPLANGNYGHSQYLAKTAWLGDLVRVLDLVGVRTDNLERLRSTPQMFPPVLISVPHAISHGGWERVGHAEVSPFEPVFRMINQILDKPGQYRGWFIDNLRDPPRLVDILPNDLRTVEFRALWWPSELAKRIATRRDPYAQYY